jgi:hypothetical protein
MEPTQDEENGNIRGIDKIFSRVSQTLSEITLVHEHALRCVSFSNACLRAIQNEGNQGPNPELEELTRDYLGKVEHILNDYGDQIEFAFEVERSKKEKK